MAKPDELPNDGPWDEAADFGRGGGRQRRNRRSDKDTIHELKHQATKLRVQLEQLRVANESLKLRADTLSEICAVNRLAVHVVAQVSPFLELELTPGVSSSSRSTIQCIETCIEHIMQLLRGQEGSLDSDSGPWHSQQPLFPTSLDKPLSEQLLDGRCLSLMRWCLHMLLQYPTDMAALVGTMTVEAFSSTVYVWWGVLLELLQRCQAADSAPEPVPPCMEGATDLPIAQAAVSALKQARTSPVRVMQQVYACVEAQLQARDGSATAAAQLAAKVGQLQKAATEQPCQPTEPGSSSSSSGDSAGDEAGHSSSFSDWHACGDQCSERGSLFPGSNFCCTTAGAAGCLKGDEAALADAVMAVCCHAMVIYLLRPTLPFEMVSQASLKFPQERFGEVTAGLGMAPQQLRRILSVAALHQQIRGPALRQQQCLQARITALLTSASTPARPAAAQAAAESARQASSSHRPHQAPVAARAPPSEVNNSSAHGDRANAGLGSGGSSSSSDPMLRVLGAHELHLHLQEACQQLADVHRINTWFECIQFLQTIGAMSIREFARLAVSTAPGPPLPVSWSRYVLAQVTAGTPWALATAGLLPGEAQQVMQQATSTGLQHGQQQQVLASLAAIFSSSQHAAHVEPLGVCATADCSVQTLSDDQLTELLCVESSSRLQAHTAAPPAKGNAGGGCQGTSAVAVQEVPGISAPAARQAVPHPAHVHAFHPGHAGMQPQLAALAGECGSTLHSSAAADSAQQQHRHPQAQGPAPGVAAWLLRQQSTRCSATSRPAAVTGPVGWLPSSHHVSTGGSGIVQLQQQQQQPQQVLLPAQQQQQQQQQQATPSLTLPQLPHPGTSVNSSEPELGDALLDLCQGVLCTGTELDDDAVHLLDGLLNAAIERAGGPV